MQTQTQRRQGSLRTISIPADEVLLEGDLELPEDARGVVLFAHGSGSSRFSPRNRHVASSLRASANVGTLLIDLLSSSEEGVDQWTREYRFDIDLLARRLQSAVQWLAEEPSTRPFTVGLFGASTGAAAALVAAARLPGSVGAVVSRGGRADLAGEALAAVQAPTLLIVGSKDHPVIELNRGAQQLLTTSALEVVPGAGHLFEEPGALDQVARLAAAWFVRYLHP